MPKQFIHLNTIQSRFIITAFMHNMKLFFARDADPDQESSETWSKNNRQLQLSARIYLGRTCPGLRAGQFTALVLQIPVNGEISDLPGELLRGR